MAVYTEDEEYMAYVGHLIEKPKVQKLGTIPITITRPVWNTQSMYPTPATRLQRNWVGMRNQRLGAVSCMICFFMIGAIPNLKRVMLGFIHGLPSAMRRS